MVSEGSSSANIFDAVQLTYKCCVYTENITLAQGPDKIQDNRVAMFTMFKVIEQKRLSKSPLPSTSRNPPQPQSFGEGH